MTRENALEKLRECAANTFDIEAAHGNADDVLCDLLNSLGFEDVVAQWNLVSKWYA